MRVIHTLLLAAALVAVSAASVQAASHCVTKIDAFARASATAAPVPPYSTMTSGICPHVDNAGPADGETFTPQADQVFVRIHGDFGPSVPAVRVNLTGLGFDRTTFVLNRTQQQLGGFTYDMRTWVFLPDAAEGGDLTITAAYPDGSMTTVYHSSPFVTPPAGPALRLPGS